MNKHLNITNKLILFALFSAILSPLYGMNAALRNASKGASLLRGVNLHGARGISSSQLYPYQQMPVQHLSTASAHQSDELTTQSEKQTKDPSFYTYTSADLNYSITDLLPVLGMCVGASGYDDPFLTACGVAAGAIALAKPHILRYKERMYNEHAQRVLKNSGLESLPTSDSWVEKIVFANLLKILQKTAFKIDAE
jgi:hypothetical protein